MNRVTLRNGRNPFEFALVGVCAVTGLAGLLIPVPGPSKALLSTFGPVGAQWFYLLMMISSLIVLIGTFWQRKTVRQLAIGMRIEQIGLLPLGGACVSYGAAILMLNGVPAITSGMLTTGIGIACWARCRIVAIDIRRVDKLIKLDVQATTPPPAPEEGKR